MPKLLIIEDDKLIRWSLQEILSNEGYLIDTADKMSAAMKSAQNKHYDVIFIDWELEDSNPADSIKKLRQLQPHSEWIVLSAMNSQEDDRIIQREDIFKLIEKPFQTDAVKDVVKQALRRKDIQNRKE